MQQTPAFAPARAHGRHLFAANDPLSPADRELAAQFATPADGEQPLDLVPVAEGDRA